MLEKGLQFRNDDRFYNPLKSHKNEQQMEISKDENAISENGESEEPSTIARCSILDRFLKSTTPSVPVQHLSQTRMRGWRACDVEFQQFFALTDLWESFEEWSAYGAGVPLLLNGSDCVVQYYVPYLSGIQLYGESAAKPDGNTRQPGEESDGNYYRDSSSDGSSDCELERDLKYSREKWNRSRPNEATLMERLSLRENHVPCQDGFSSQEGEVGNSQCYLLFEFLEQEPPYSREPLADKISVLSSLFPGLKTLRSCDLLPSSWISVAWYPIYRIPTGPTLRDLDACFLTFHSLSTPVGGNGSDQGPKVTCPHGIESAPMISLPVFGLASYKFKGSMWTLSSGCEGQMAASLFQAAGNWLRLLQVDHPDFQFFASHGVYRR